MQKSYVAPQKLDRVISLINEVDNAITQPFELADPQLRDELYAFGISNLLQAREVLDDVIKNVNSNYRVIDDEYGR